MALHSCVLSDPNSQTERLPRSTHTNGSLSRVAPLMSHKVSALHEPLPTLIAHKRSLSSRGSLAGSKRRLLALVCPALWGAGEGLLLDHGLWAPTGACPGAVQQRLLSVGSLVRQHYPLVPEPFLALRTLIRLLLCLDLLAAETHPILQAFPPFATWPLAPVDPLVAFQVLLLAAGLPALVAPVGPLACVDPLMDDEGFLVLEALPALGAGKRPLPRVDALVAD